MTEADLDDFGAAWSQMSEVLAGKDLSQGAQIMVFELLKSHPLNSVLGAMGRHMSENRWMPSPAEIIELIHGPTLTNEELIGLASSPDRTVLGSYVRQRITPHTLNHWSMYDILAHMKTLRPDIDRFIEEYNAGRVSDGDMRLLNASGHNGREPLRTSLGVRTDTAAVEYKPNPDGQAKIRALTRSISGRVSG